MHMKIDSIIGDEDTYSIEHRVLNTVLVFGIAITIIVGVLNYAINLTLMAVVSLLSGIILLGLHYLSLVRRQYVFSLYVATLTIFIVTPILWMFNGGITGGTPYYIIIFSSMIAVAVSGFKRIVFSGCLVSMSLILLVAQLTTPGWTTGYSCEIVRLDNFLGLLITIIVNASLYVTIVNQYNKEHVKARSFFIQIEKQKTELELHRLERLNLIGEMAASIGHEIRNPLTTVRGFLQLFQSRKEYVRDTENFNIIIQELDRANSIISEFLSLAKNKRVDLKPANLDEIVLKLAPLMQAIAIREGKQLFLELNSVFEILADENEIKQLILNLTKNAFEATQKGENIILKTYKDKNFGVLMIKDNGSGIPPDIYEKMGRPFLTTKVGGTGLGIPICFSIAERHKAKIEIETSQAGTAFFIRFDIYSSPNTHSIEKQV